MKIVIGVVSLAWLATAQALQFTFINKCNDKIDLVDSTWKPETIPVGGTITREITEGGGFRNSTDPQGTLAEFTVGGMGFTWYDISIIPPGSGACKSYAQCMADTGQIGYNVPMAIEPQSDKCKKLKCEEPACEDAYNYPSDDIKTNACDMTVPMHVIFCPSGTATTTTSKPTTQPAATSITPTTTPATTAPVTTKPETTNPTTTAPVTTTTKPTNTELPSTSAPATTTTPTTTTTTAPATTESPAGTVGPATTPVPSSGHVRHTRKPRKCGTKKPSSTTKPSGSNNNNAATASTTTTTPATSLPATTTPATSGGHTISFTTTPPVATSKPSTAAPSTTKTPASSASTTQTPASESGVLPSGSLSSATILNNFTYTGQYAGNMAGTYDMVVDHKACTKQTVSVNNPIGPLSEEVTVVFRGPMNLYDVAVFDGSSGGAWQRVSSFSKDAKTSSNLVFMNNKNVDYSGGGGSPQAYSTADGKGIATSATQFGGVLDTDVEVNIVLPKLCSEDKACKGFYDASGHHGWNGGRKLFVTKVNMPINGAATPAIWMLNTQIVHTNQYGCNCRGMGPKGGCGELDIAEVISEDTTRVLSHYYFLEGTVQTGAYWAPRRTTGTTVYATLLDTDGPGTIKVFELSGFDFATTSISTAQISAWLK